MHWRWAVRQAVWIGSLENKLRESSLGRQASIILVLRRWRQEDCEFEAYLSYLEKPSLKKKIETPFGFVSQCWRQNPGFCSTSTLPLSHIPGPVLSLKYNVYD